MSELPRQRRLGRESALQVLYLADVNPDLTVAQALARFYDLCGAGEDATPLPEGEAQHFCERLVRGALAAREELDEIIRRHSRNWRLERMSIVDRNVLRLASFELRGCPDVPARVTLNEAVELARRFGSVESSAFVNGILDRIAAETPRD
jgi:N utilization substance protein B